MIKVLKICSLVVFQY